MIRKTFFVTVAVVVMLITLSVAAFANPYTLGAENGKILAPAGLGFDLFANVNQPQQTGISLNSELSYGISSALTLTGSFRNLNSDDRQTMVKAFFSPMHGGTGYTVYLGYDLGAGEIPVYGLSLWSDMKYLFGYVNLESNDQTLTVTPGVNVRFGSKLRVGGELALNLSDGSKQNLRLGTSYALSKKLNAKVSIDTGFDRDVTPVITTGLAMQF